MDKKIERLVNFEEEKEFEIVDGKPKYKERHSTNNEDGKNKNYSGLDMTIIKRRFKDMTDLNKTLELGLDRKTLSNYIHGKTVPPVDIVNIIANACETTMDSLVLRSDRGKLLKENSFTKVVYRLNKDNTFEPYMVSKGGKRFYVTYNFRRYNELLVLEPYILMYDCNVFKAGKGSVLLVDRNIINIFLKTNIDSYCLIKKRETITKTTTDRFGRKTQTTEEVETLHPTIIRRIRSNGLLENMPLNMITYINLQGMQEVINFKDFAEKLFFGRVITIVHEV